MNRRDPFGRRRYLHFDAPVSRKSLRALATDPCRVESWGFLPLLRVDVVSRKVRKDADGTLSTRPKSRPISYASHRDAAIYAYYSGLLADKYEKYLALRPFNGSITAFRSGSGRCNIDFARDAFAAIRTLGTCTALAFDVKGFFDNLDHRLLKRVWVRLLGTAALPPDHYAVYKSVTRFSFVMRDSAYSALGVSRHNPRAHNRVNLCSAAEFRSKIRGLGLVKKNTKPFGIPQGTPISAVLSNLYMLDFDEATHALVTSYGGHYWRYCDDILCVVPTEHADTVSERVRDALRDSRLQLQDDKTHRHDFATGSRTSDPLQYLGFVFDGERVMLRTAGVSRYYAKMRAGVRAVSAGRRATSKREGVVQPLRTTKLYIRYSYLGRRNFISYALRASRHFGDLAIKNQIKRHWRALRILIAQQSSAT